MKPIGYSTSSKLFHWLVAVLVALEFVVAGIMPGVHRGLTAPEGLIMIHLSFGIVILVVILLRLAWRLTHPLPPSPEGTHWLQELAAKGTHYALYASLVAMPFVGWAWASSLGWQVSLFNLVTLPALVPKDPSLVRIAGPAHVLLGGIIIALIGFHAVAALYHWIVLNDGVMERMLPSFLHRKNKA